MDTKKETIPARKSIALVAHDNQKDELGAWVTKNRDLLAKHRLFATGTTGYMLERQTKLSIEKLVSGPLGGDQQIGARIAEGDVNVLIFFWDPFEPMPHDPDVKALLRVAAVWNIPVACNAASADFIIRSECFSLDFERLVPDYDRYIQTRLKQF